MSRHSRTGWEPGSPRLSWRTDCRQNPASVPASWVSKAGEIVRPVPMNPSRYRWVIVALGGLMGCVAIGAMFSLAVFLGPISGATGWSRATISSAMTLDFLVMGLAGFGWGAVSDRLGPRPVVLIGAIVLGAGLWIASRATS